VAKDQNRLTDLVAYYKRLTDLVDLGSGGGGTTQNPFPAYYWPGYTYQEHDSAPTLPGVLAPAPARCECESGSHTKSGAHSHWCPMWVSA